MWLGREAVDAVHVLIWRLNLTVFTDQLPAAGFLAGFQGTGVDMPSRLALLESARLVQVKLSLRFVDQTSKHFKVRGTSEYSRNDTCWRLSSKYK